MTTPSVTVATVSSDDVHTTLLSVASSGVTVAVRVRVSPSVISAVVLSRVRPVEEMNFALTVISHVAVLSPFAAVIVTLPAFIAVTTPSVTVATVSSDDVHTTLLSVASSGVTVAVRVRVSPSIISAVVLSRVRPVEATIPPPTFTVVLLSVTDIRFPTRSENCIPEIVISCVPLKSAAAVTVK